MSVFGKSLLKVAAALTVSRLSSLSTQDIRPVTKSLMKGGIILYGCAKYAMHEITRQADERRKENHR